MWHCTRMGCCNKQRAAGTRIAGPPQPSLRQRLSAFFLGRGLIPPQEYGLLPSILHSVGGFAVPVAVARGTATEKWPQSSHFPKPLSRHTPYGMQKPPTEFPMPTTASGIYMQTLDTCPAHMLLLLTPSHQASRHQTSGILWKPHYAQAAIFVGHGPCLIPSPVAI